MFNDTKEIPPTSGAEADVRFPPMARTFADIPTRFSRVSGPGEAFERAKCGYPGPSFRPKREGFPYRYERIMLLRGTVLPCGYLPAITRHIPCLIIVRVGCWVADQISREMRS